MENKDNETVGAKIRNLLSPIVNLSEAVRVGNIPRDLLLKECDQVDINVKRILEIIKEI